MPCRWLTSITPTENQVKSVSDIIASYPQIKALIIVSLVLVEAAGVERFFHSLESITYLFSIAYETAQRPKMPFSWYSFGTVFGTF
jgi:hypothetical protein